jgi:hypothetical protein
MVYPVFPKPRWRIFNTRGSKKTLDFGMRPSAICHTTQRDAAQRTIESRTWRKNMPGIVHSFKKVTRLEIVWRNSNPVRRYLRRHCFKRTDERTLYLSLEFVGDGPTGYWTTLSGLEVVLGGRMA